MKKKMLGVLMLMGLVFSMSVIAYAAMAATSQGERLLALEDNDAVASHVINYISLYGDGVMPMPGALLEFYNEGVWEYDGIIDYDTVAPFSVLGISCPMCGSWPVSVIRTDVGAWRWTGGRVGPHVDWTFSYEYIRFTRTYFRGACNFQGVHSASVTTWFNTFNRP